MSNTHYKLRTWQPADLDSLVAHAHNRDIARFMSDVFPYPYTPEHGRAFIHMAAGEKPTRIFAIEVDGKAVGSIGIHPQHDIRRKNAELGYWLGQPYWGRGIVTAAVLEMVAYGFRTFNITRIFARPFGSNPASQRVLEKAGFKLEARIEKSFFKWGSYEDELIYAVRRTTDDGSKEPDLTFDV